MTRQHQTQMTVQLRQGGGSMALPCAPATRRPHYSLSRCTQLYALAINHEGELHTINQGAIGYILTDDFIMGAKEKSK